MILSESVLVQMMIISLPEPSTPTKGCEWPWWGFCRDDGLARSLRAGFFQLGWFGWLFLIMRIKHLLMTSTILCCGLLHPISLAGSLNRVFCSQIPEVPSPSLHSCNVKSVPRCSTRGHTCVQAWTMQHFWSYKCSKNRIPVIWYFILMNFNFFFLFIATLFTLYVWIKII